MKLFRLHYKVRALTLIEKQKRGRNPFLETGPASVRMIYILGRRFLKSPFVPWFHQLSFGAFFWERMSHAPAAAIPTAKSSISGVPSSPVVGALSVEGLPSEAPPEEVP